MFLVLCLMATFAYGQGNSDRTLLLRFTAKGIDVDQPETITTLMTGKIESVEGSPLDVGQVNFRTEIRDESGEVVCKIQGHLKDAMAMLTPSWFCPIRLHFWRDFYIVVGMGKVKAISTVTMINYRGEPISAPNTGGKYVTLPILMMVSLDGKYSDTEAGPIVGYFGGWALAGLVTEMVGGMPTKFVGGIAYLTNWLDKRVP
jgi:hypothetical protein